MEQVGHGQSATLTQTNTNPSAVQEVPRPAITARRVGLLPIHGQAGWDALSSNEHVDDHNAKPQTRASMSLPKRFKKPGIPLKRLKHLSAIIESPRSRSARTPSMAQQQWENTVIAAAQRAPIGRAETTDWPVNQADNVFDCPGSPRTDVVPSLAIRSPAQYGATIADGKPKPPRSVSVGALPAHFSGGGAAPGHLSGLTRPQMHARSISLGAQPPSQPPSDPVPPLPVIGPHISMMPGGHRQGLCISRSSSSSQESASSSVLVTSPIIQVKSQKQAVKSPSVEQVVADDDEAELKSVQNSHWQSPLFARPGSAAAVRKMSAEAFKASLHGSGIESAPQLSSPSSCSSIDASNDRLSIPRVSTADRISISRISSVGSFKSVSGLRKTSTPPRRTPRSSVSANGSPAERRRAGVLRDISGNSLSPTRQPSNATQDSGNSSDGNPFQWDIAPPQKPSAMKGSPNARKGHRRQNCVRISTLTPQVLGPPPSRPTSPSIMHGIEEEGADEGKNKDLHGLPFVTNHRLPRPPSATMSAPSLRVQTLRASLTPNSPTLSMWAAYQEHGLPSQPSDSHLSASSGGERSRSASRGSAYSSVFSIPSFPSPGKATVSQIQLDQPVPEFSLSRPSTDVEEERTSPLALRASPKPRLQSSPPFSSSKTKEYDTAWPVISIPASGGAEYDPASPAVVCTDPERSSPFFASTVTVSSNALSPSRSPSFSGDVADSAPCSPRTMPEGFASFFDRQTAKENTPRAAEKLTSENASSIMAHLPTVDFPGAPVLYPTRGGGSIPAPLRNIRNRSVSNTFRLQPTRAAPTAPPTSSDECIPSPLNLKHSPQGPRSEPAKSVLKNAMALRRMNSEVDTTRSRESRRYLRLGREASPVLPFTGIPHPSESCNDLFDFGFGNTQDDDADSGAARSGHDLEDADVGDWDRRLEHALKEVGSPTEERNGRQANPSSDIRDEQRDSSVGEDGEEFWQQRAHPEARSSRVDISFAGRNEQTPRGGQEQATASHLGGVAGSGAAHQSLSIAGTPGSLYDADGFLRT